MAEGTVTYFDEDGGYGFIETDATDGDDEDVFFHMAEIEGPDLVEGTDIEFEIETAEKGPRADNVVRVDEDE